MSLRHIIAHHLMRWSLHLTRPPLTIEGIAVMKLWDAISDVRKQIADINSKLADHGQAIAGSVDPDQFKALQDVVAALPTKDQVSSAIGAAMEEEIGDEPTGDDTQSGGAGDSILSGAGNDSLPAGTAPAAPALTPFDATIS